MKSSAIFNYIPHHRPRKSNFNDWYEYYEKDLSVLYSITQGVVKERYNTEIGFENFIKFIFQVSSQYIPPY